VEGLKGTKASSEFSLRMKIEDPITRFYIAHLGSHTFSIVVLMKEVSEGPPSIGFLMVGVERGKILK
jgi:hypothetical protein